VQEVKSKLLWSFFCEMLMVGFCCLLVRDSDYVVVVFGKVNNVPITFQLYSCNIPKFN
jgi:hypothetical protein